MQNEVKNKSNCLYNSRFRTQDGTICYNFLDGEMIFVLPNEKYAAAN